MQVSFNFQIQNSEFIKLNLPNVFKVTDAYAG